MSSAPEASREQWLNGWQRVGHLAYVTNGIHCAGCGKFLHVWTSIAVSSDHPPLSPEPQWPFDEETCPVCALAAIQDTAQDRLTARLLAYKATCRT